MPEYHDLYLGAGLSDVDPSISRLVELEGERQARRIILIPSESIAPAPVREALGSVFTNIYAEGYPPLRMTRDDEAMLADLGHQLTYYRRYGDRRFYKGADYVNFVEALAQRRCAVCFANERVEAENLHVNVQPLSGAAANLAAYDALMDPGDTFLGMDLFQGGHLTHGSEFNLSGRRYKVASYGVDPDSGRLDYDGIMELALAARPRVIVAGFTSFPWAPDWERFRDIADACGAYLMADIAHPAGLVVAGAYPSPVGLADVVTFTTHKTLCGPRGAVILTADAQIARQIDRAVFPGAQGGPHTNKFAAMAVAFGIARAEPFQRMMWRIVENAQALASSLQARGLGLAYGGTDTHLLMIDLRSIETPTKEPLRGEVAVRLMELAGLVANKNTIPGDSITALGSGVRLGTPWVTQRGMGAGEMDEIAESISTLLKAIHPFRYQGLRREMPRGKVDAGVLERVKAIVADLASRSAAETESLGTGYPHYSISGEAQEQDGSGLLLLRGHRATPFLQQAGTAEIAGLQSGDRARSFFLDRKGALIGEVDLLRLESRERTGDRFALVTHSRSHEKLKSWLRALSDGYVLFDDDDIYRKVDGPVVVEDVDLGGCDDREAVSSTRPFRDELTDRNSPAPSDADALALYHGGHSERICLTKPYFVGQSALESARSKVTRKEFHWQKPADAPVRRTPLYDVHAGATRQIIPFAGWEMPVWYSSVGDEHQIVRQAAGLFDVAHMGVFEASGPQAASFLDVVTTNYVRRLSPGQSQYSYLLGPGGSVIDDVMVYCLARDRYILVVNAANTEKDWAWLNAVNEGSVVIDRANPAMAVPQRATLRDLQDPACGPDRRVDLALQGTASLPALQSLADDRVTKEVLRRLRRTDLVELTLSGIDLIVARTGYTGEKFGYELLVHPDRAIDLWNLLLERGSDLGVKPCGLGARDSTRIEAGLPLYGHELAGPLDVLPHEAGFPSYVKYHKAFFVGRSAVMERASRSDRALVRFRVGEKGVRALRGGEHGEPVVNRRGRYVGQVTSCALVGDTQVGLALVDSRQAERGTELAIYPLGGRAGNKPLGDLGPGDSVTLPILATVLRRFPSALGRASYDEED